MTIQQIRITFFPLLADRAPLLAVLMIPNRAMVLLDLLV